MRRFSIYLIASLVVFVTLASYLFVSISGMENDFDFPANLIQWPIYAWSYTDNPGVPFWLSVSALPAAFLSITLLMPAFWSRSSLPSQGYGWWRPRLRWPVSRPRPATFAPAAPYIGHTDNFGHAAWATEDEMRARWPSPSAAHGAVVIGELYDPRKLKGPYKPSQPSTWGPGGRAPFLYDDRLSGSGHSVDLAGSGTGKTQKLILSLRSTWRGTVVVLDPKKNLVDDIREDRERMGHRVIVLDPSFGFDVLDWIDPRAPLVDPKIDRVVEWVCGETPEHGGGDNTKFFTGAAKDIIRGICSHMIADPSMPDRTLRVPRTIVCSAEREFREYLKAIYENSPSSRARELLAFVCSEANDTVRSIQYTAQRITAWLSTPEWSNMVCGTDFHSWDITDGQTDIILPIAFQDLASEPALARCILGALFNAVFEANGNIPQPILFALDEIAQIREFEPLKTAWTMGREYKISLHLMYQDDTQVKKQWGPDGRRALASGATWIAYAGIKDAIEARDVSEMIGDYPVVALSESLNTGTQGQPMRLRSRSHGSSLTYSEMGRRRIRPEEIIGLRDDTQILLARGIGPMICGIPADHKVRHFATAA